MYKLKIEHTFIDKNTGAEYSKNDVISFDDARGEELLADSRELVSLVEKSASKSRNKKEPDQRIENKC